MPLKRTATRWEKLYLCLSNSWGRPHCCATQARRGTALAAPYSSVSKPPPAPALELAGRLVPYRDPILALEAGDFFVHRTLGK